jgi:hypothetical protein
MRVLRPIVQLAAAPFKTLEGEFVLRHAVALHLLRNQPAWVVLKDSEQALEESLAPLPFRRF